MTVSCTGWASGLSDRQGQASTQACVTHNMQHSSQPLEYGHVSLDAAATAQARPGHALWPRRLSLAGLLLAGAGTCHSPAPHRCRARAAPLPPPAARRPPAQHPPGHDHTRRRPRAPSKQPAQPPCPFPAQRQPHTSSRQPARPATGRSAACLPASKLARTRCARAAASSARCSAWTTCRIRLATLALSSAHRSRSVQRPSPPWPLACAPHAHRAPACHTLPRALRAILLCSMAATAGQGRTALASWCSSGLGLLFSTPSSTHSGRRVPACGAYRVVARDLRAAAAMEGARLRGQAGAPPPTPWPFITAPKLLTSAQKCGLSVRTQLRPCAASSYSKALLAGSLAGSLGSPGETLRLEVSLLQLALTEVYDIYEGWRADQGSPSSRDSSLWQPCPPAALCWSHLLVYLTAADRP